jgi:hypothetical protein
MDERPAAQLSDATETFEEHAVVDPPKMCAARHVVLVRGEHFEGGHRESIEVRGQFREMLFGHQREMKREVHPRPFLVRANCLIHGVGIGLE